MATSASSGTGVGITTSITTSGGAPPSSTGTSTNVYTVFNEEDIIRANNAIVTENVWSSGIGGTLSTFYTSSTQVTASGDYYYDIYQTEATESNAAVQFSIAYGNYNGSGSYEKFPNMGVNGYTPSKAVYSQYKNIILAKGTSQFTLYSGANINQFIAVNFKRSRLKDKVDPGNWELTLSDGATVTHLIDSNTGTNESTVADSYDIVSGSIENGIYSSSAPKYYGKIYPKHGVLIIDGDMLKNSASIDVTQSTLPDVTPNNNTTMYNAIVAGGSFQVRNKQTVSSTYYFIRVKNGKYNYSTNPSYTTGSTGVLRFQEWVTDPVTYITTVGLFDNAKNLLAVAKISQPIKKTKSDEALIKVKLNY